MSDAKLLRKKVLSMDATGLLEAYQKGDITPGEAVDIFINHQKHLKPEKLNLVVEDRYKEAKEEARKYDALLKEGKINGKLFGIPISMKEALDVDGMHTTGGLNYRKDRLAQNDAEVVKRLRQEGAIILNKTNTPTMCFCQETDNLLFGRSNNPWNKKCTTGGSSGGEAALIAVGGAAAGFGSDIGGSIRIPSHFNGVVGFKPGAYQYPMAGHFPHLTLEVQGPMLGFGPITKSVRDAALIYSIIHPEFQPPESWALPEKLKVISFDSQAASCTKETLEILSEAKNALRINHVQVDDQPKDYPKFMEDVALIWQLVMSYDGGIGILGDAYPHLKEAKTKDYFKVLLDWVKAKLRLKPFNHHFISWAIFGAWLFTPNQKGKERIKNFTQTHLKEIEQLVGDSSVFLLPVYPSPAKKHGKIFSEIFSIAKSFKWKMRFTTFANTFGLPSLVVPCGKSKKGLPIGLQVVSTVGNEALVFRVASFLESHLGGYQRNESYD